MDQATQDSHDELEINLGNIALDRSRLYGLLKQAIQAPTMDLAEGLLNGEVHNHAEASVQWINSRSGIFNDSLAILNRFVKENTERNVEDLYKNMQEEYKRMFLHETDSRILLNETAFLQLKGNEKIEVENSVKEVFTKDELSNFYRERPYDHLINEISYLEHLCYVEGAAWQEGKVPKAKLWRRKEREFTVNHLEKWGEAFFIKVEETTELQVYKAIASLGKVFMRLENGY